MTGALAVQLRKEARALLPWSAAVAAATIALAVFAARGHGFPTFRNDRMIWLLIAHVAGVMTVAALSLGHEFAHGALGSLLVQPVDRRRVLWTKLLVCAAILVPLAAMAEAVFPRLGALNHPYAGPLLIWGPVAAGIGLVPVLTLLTRKPLGGVVFAIMVPWLILFVGQRYFPIVDGPQALAITWYGTVVASVAGLVALFYVFPRLEVAGSGAAWPRSQEVGAGAAVAAPFIRRHWVWAQIRKELRLQQLTFAVSGLYILAAIATLVAQQDPLYVGPTFTAASLLHGFFITVIAGSVASAEERHIGTLTSQALHPVAAWRQWFVKSATTIGLSCVLAIGLPLMMMVVLLILQPAYAPGVSFDGEWVVGILLTSIAALYVSSLSSNNLWALLSCFPAIGGSLLFTAGFIDPLIRTLRRQFWVGLNVEGITPAMKQNIKDPGWRALREAQVLYNSVNAWTLVALLVGLALLVLYLAGRNHRSLDRSAGKILRQAGLLAGYVVCGAVIYVAVTRLTWVMLR